MPSVALRQAQWTTDEARHLMECRSCNQEWELVQAGIRLADTGPVVRGSDALTQMLLQRLAQKDTANVRRGWTAASLATAAALAAAVWLGSRGSPRVEPQEPGAVVAGLQMPLPELESLQPAELESVLQAMDDSVTADDTSDETELLDLDTDELQQVLDTWEG
jgi:hypothetical protein